MKIEEEIRSLGKLCDPGVDCEYKEGLLEEWCVERLRCDPPVYVSGGTGLYGTLPLEGGSLRKGYTLLAWVRVGCVVLEEEVLLWKLSSPHGSVSCYLRSDSIRLEVGCSADSSPPPHSCQGIVTPIELPSTKNTTDSKQEEGEWMLLGFHHLLPYLKRPHMVVHINGLEAGKCELAYVLSEETDVQLTGFAAPIQLAGLACFREGIPGPIQSMACEYGYCEEILPSNMPHASVVTHKDALVGGSSSSHHYSSDHHNKKSASHNHNNNNNNSNTLALKQRHVGIPTTVGVLLSSMGDMTWDLLLSRLAQTMVCFAQLSSLIETDNGKEHMIKIVLHPGPRLVGDLSSTPKLGLVSPVKHHHSSKNNHKRNSLLLTEEHYLYLPDAQVTRNSNSHLSLAQILAIQPMHFLLLTLMRAMPPPSPQLHSTTWSNYQTLQQQLIQNDYRLTRLILHTVASYIKFNGSCRDDILQQGHIFTLWNTLLRLIVETQDIVPHNKNNNNNNDSSSSSISPTFHPPPSITTTTTTTTTTSNDDDDEQFFSILPIHMQLPPSIEKAWEQIVFAACGDVMDETNTCKMPPPLHIRRTSDLALTVGMVSFPHIFTALEKLYFSKNLEYGWLWRGQVSVQWVLDVLITYHDNSSSTINFDAATNVILTLLSYSLSSSKHALRGEEDVSACVRALAFAPLGSVVVHAILASIIELLHKGKTLRDKHHVKEIVPSSTSNQRMNNNNNNDNNNNSIIGKNKKNNTSSSTNMEALLNKLFRNLTMGQFHDVVAPMLLSRTIQTQSSNNNNNQNLWKQHWWWTLQIFVSLTSVLGAEGEFASKSTGNLLLASGHAGSLADCWSDPNNPDVDWHSLLLPAFSSIGSGKKMQMDNYITNMSLRLKMLLHLLPGLVSSLLTFPNKMQSLLNLVTRTLRRLYGVGTPPPCNKLLVLQVCKDATPQLLTVARLLQRANCNCNSVITSASLLLWQAMVVGGGEASTSIWRMVIVAFEYQNDNEDDMSLLCQLVTLVLNKITSTDSPWKNVELCSSAARLMDMIEEKKLLTISKENHNHTSDQVGLIVAILDVLRSGREVAGWCQWTPASIDAMKMKSSNSNLLDNERSGLKVPSPSNLYERYNNNNKIRHPNSDLPTAAWLLPVLQPCLRLLLQCLGNIPSDASILKSNQINSEEDDKKLLLQQVIHELKQSLTASIVGLYFGNARDIGLQALARARAAAELYKNNPKENKDAVRQCHSFFLSIIEELCARYVAEQHYKEQNLNFYQQDHDTIDFVQHTEAANSQAVENVLVGDDLTQSQDASDDFILFPSMNEQYIQMEKKKKKLIISNWNQFKGLGACLGKCREIVHEQKEKDVGMLAEESLTLLKPFLDQWNERLKTEQDETELLEMFAYMGSGSIIRGSMSNDKVSVIKNDEPLAAEAMASFIELSSSEQLRLKETDHYIDWNRQVSFSQTACFKFSLQYMNDDWERGISDGGRDYGARLVTVPTIPQFAREIPAFMDHTINTQNDSHITPKKVICENGDGQDKIDDEWTTLMRKSSMKIIDITKVKRLTEFEGLDSGAADSSKLILENNLIEEVDDDSDGNSLGFPENVSVAKKDLNGSSNEFLFDETMDSKPANDIRGSLKSVTSQGTHQSSRISESIKKQISRPAGDSNNHSSFSVSSFAHPPDGACNVQQNTVEMLFDNVLHVKPEGSRKGTLLITATHLILEYEPGGLFEGEEREQHHYDDGDDDHLDSEECRRQLLETAALRPRALRWNTSELSHVYLRRYRLRDSALEMFFIPSGGGSIGATGLSSSGASTSVFLDIGGQNRDQAANAIMKRAPSQTVKQWPESSGQFLHEQLRHLTMGWVKGRVSNLDYLLSLNCLAGRSYNDLCQYPVMPWVLSNYTSEEIPDLTDESNFRDLSKPMGALNSQRLDDFLERFQTFQDPTIPPFMYGSHYSTSAGVVLHFLVRLHPFASLHRQLQSGHFDVADRLFSSVPRTWDMCTGSSAAEVKELTPEWYLNPAFLRNANQFKLGTMQEGECLDDVTLPPWAKNSPDLFVEVMRSALESDVCSAMLPNWIDLIFGRKQQGPDAVDAHNVFFYLTYYGSVDVASIEDEALRTATELQIAHFGQCPMQLFYRPHVHKFARTSKRRKISLGESWGLHDLTTEINSDTSNVKNEVGNLFNYNNEKQLPFSSAPLSYWVHLAAPPPGSYAPLISIRLAGTDRCIAVDAQGIFHFFRWAWRPAILTDEQKLEQTQSNDLFSDQGCFIAQRELPHFRTVPRLPYSPIEDGIDSTVVVAFSSTLFASRSQLLVLSDGDGHGTLSLQLVDPAKGIVQGEILIPDVHSDCISSIAMDSIGTACGMGGVGGELAVLGSRDGTASVWRFISSQFLPLRPRCRINAHLGQPIVAVAICTALNLCATLSSKRCCITSLANGNVIRIIQPPSDDVYFSDSCSVCLSSQGFVVIVSQFKDNEDYASTLHLYSLEGIHLGQRNLPIVPKKVSITAKGRAILVCGSKGISVYALSTICPFKKVDSWQMDNEAYDIDIHSVVAAAACSEGALRLHALKGISEWSEEFKQSKTFEAVGHALAKPAQKLKNVASGVKGIGSKFVGFGRDISREAMSDVREGRVGSFFGGIMGNSANKR